MAHVCTEQEVRPVVIDGTPYVEITTEGRTLLLPHTLARVAAERALKNSWEQHEESARRGLARRR